VLAFAIDCGATVITRRPGEDEVDVGEALDFADAHGERAAEDDEEKGDGHDGRQDRLRPKREDPPHLAAGECDRPAALADGQLGDGHGIAST
jgi:hypothetical protein